MHIVILSQKSRFLVNISRMVSPIIKIQKDLNSADRIRLNRYINHLTIINLITPLIKQIKLIDYTSFSSAARPKNKKKYAARSTQIFQSFDFD